MPSEFVERDVSIAGHDIHYVRGGAGAPLVLLHSNGASSREFGAVAPELARDADVCCVDLPGFGGSARSVDPFRIEAATDAIASFIDATDLDRPVVAGTSIGGTIAADLAARHPGSTRGVVLVETPCRPDEDWATLWPIVERLFTVPTQNLDDIRGRFRDPTPELLDRWNSDRNTAGGELMMDAMWAIRNFDLPAAAARIRRPCLLVFGANGAVADGADHLERLIPDAERVDLPECGHFPMIDDPAAFAATVSRFVHEITGRGES